MAERDGSYYAKDGQVWKHPVEKKLPGGSRISIGFPVCKMTDIVGDEAAETVAELMNQGDAVPALVKALEEIEDLGANGATAARLGNIAHAALIAIRAPVSGPSTGDSNV